jgi:hypothetical protein
VPDGKLPYELQAAAASAHLMGAVPANVSYVQYKLLSVAWKD